MFFIHEGGHVRFVRISEACIAFENSQDNLFLLLKKKQILKLKFNVHEMQQKVAGHLDLPLLPFSRLYHPPQVVTLGVPFGVPVASSSLYIMYPRELWW